MRVALLDENGVYLGLVHVNREDLTALHLPQITECDLEPGKYQWVPDTNAVLGGAFWPVKFLNRLQQDKLDVQAANEAAQRMAQRRAQRRREREQEQKDQQPAPRPAPPPPEVIE